MVERLMEFFRARMPIATEHETLVRSLVSSRRVKKGEALQRAGEVATHGCFVADGCLRSYSIDEEGREHVLQFAPEGWWLTDFNSMRDQTPSTYFIEALEDSGVVLMGLAAHTRLMNELPGYAAAFATGLLKMSAARDKRLLDSLSATAEQRYLNFLETYPSVARRVPLHMLASYLGITPETLSRLRAGLARKKRVRPGAV
jgi:CRP/FNR family transcriptional regulator, anaerobic regulatory protein